jgi:F-type H+-transporting ATPase subunit b
MARYGLWLTMFVLFAWSCFMGNAFGADDKAEKAAAHAAEGGDHGKQDDHGGHAHDTTDLGHGNGTDKLTAPDAMPYDLAVGTFVVFFLLMLLLSKFAWGPISEALDKRETHIADMIATAEKNAHASEARMKELERQLAAQAESAREAINQARREGELQKEKIIAEAQAAAQRERERALSEIRDAKNVALREIAQKSVNTAVDLAKNIIRREVKANDHEQLIKDSLAQFHSQN